MSIQYYELKPNTYYVPLKRVLIVAQEAMDEKTMEELLGTITTHDAYIDTFRPEGRVYNEKYSVIPKSIQIYPTSGCNLRCRYCFSDSGNVDCRDLPIEKIRKFIAECFKAVFIAKMATGHAETVEIQFCGGGEPTFHWSLFESAVNYVEEISQKYSIPKQIKLTSNCCNTNVKHLEFIAEHIDHLHVSIDGNAEVQNYQRPTANGGNSYDAVSKALKFLVPSIKRKGGVCSLRSTITGYSVDKMVEITEHFCREFPDVDFIQFEPLNWVRKTERVGDLQAPDVRKYAQEYLKCCSVGKQYGINVVSSYGEISVIRPRGSFCDSVVGYSLILNQDGDITNCAEATRDNPRTYHPFLVGHLDDQLHFQWYNTPHASAANDKCSDDCFAWYHCGGGCLHSVLDYEVNREFRCQLAREILLGKLNMISEGQSEEIFLNTKVYDNLYPNTKIYSWDEKKWIQSC